LSSMQTAGASVDSLAHALVEQTVTVATEPRPAALAGYDGLYLELTTPATAREACGGDPVNYWDSKDAGTRWSVTPGMVERVWILNVDGQPMVVGVAVPPSASERQVNRLAAVAKTARFVGS
jgi:hypothetical protein